MPPGTLFEQRHWPSCAALHASPSEGGQLSSRPTYVNALAAMYRWHSCVTTDARPVEPTVYFRQSTRRYSEATMFAVDAQNGAVTPSSTSGVSW